MVLGEKYIFLLLAPFYWSIIGLFFWFIRMLRFAPDTASQDFFLREHVKQQRFYLI